MSFSLTVDIDSFERMPNTPETRYRFGTWTVTKLKDELRNRNLSPVGKKTELIERLERADEIGTSPSKRVTNTHRGRSPTRGRSASRSPVRIATDDTMKVSQIRDELKQLGLSPVGNKATLVHRLQEAQTTANPFMDKSNSPSRKSPTKANSLALSPTRTTLTGQKRGGMTPDDIGLLTSPITTVVLALRCAASMGKHCLSGGINRKPLAALNILAFAMLLFGVCMIQGPHQPLIKPIKQQIFWYGRWIILGILSSIGLGTGAHTFLLFLGPFVARATTAAHICKTVNFPLTGEHGLLCPAGAYEKVPVSLLMILNKVKWEAFAWGLGTAIGELPPYLIARASALAGKSAGELTKIEQLARKKNRTWTDTLTLTSYSIVSRLGFLGILLCASIPNPLFDLAGITCGYFMIPFLTFITATFLGKAVIKAGIQTMFVIFLFSRDYLEKAIYLAEKKYPTLGHSFKEWLLTQRNNFQARKADATTKVFGTVWHGMLILMMSYFIISVIRSAAILQARREGMIKP